MFTLFLTGIESAPPGALPRLPALERLLARARLRTLEESPWAYLATLAGGTARDWPVGPVSALGDAMDAPRACLRVEPLGADAAQAGAFRLPAGQLEIRRGEAEALAAAFIEQFGADGWRLEVAVPERWYLVAHGDTAVAAGWQGFEVPAQALEDDVRPAPPEPGLRRLLSEIELLFHEHPVNAARRERGAPLIAGLHAWGGGVLERPGSAPGAPAAAGEEPFLAGLRRLGVVQGAADRLDPYGIAWPAAIETFDLASLADIERRWAAPLLAALLRGRLDGVRIVTGRRAHETRRAAALRFWRRPRPVAELC